MAKFDEEFAKLSARLGAALQVIAQYPEIAAQVRDAIDGAQTAAEIQQGQAQDDARANVIANLIVGARDALAAAAPRPTDPAPPTE